MDKKLFGSNYEDPEVNMFTIKSEQLLCASVEQSSESLDELKEGTHDFGWQY